MPRYTKDPINAISVGLKQSHKELIERAGAGNTFGEKLRSILDDLAHHIDTIAGKPGSILVYEQNSEGEKQWEKAPFPFQRSMGWRAIKQVARDHDYAAEVIEDPELDTVQVWVAPSSKLSGCEACKKRILAAIS